VTLTSSGAVATAGVAGSPYTIVPSAATGGSFAAGNYSITYANGSLSVSPAPLSITAKNTSLTYGQTLPATTTNFDAVGLKNSETVGSVSQTSTATATSPAGTTAGITVSNATGGTFDAGNYTITYLPYSAGNAYQAGVFGGALSITAAPLTITASNANKTYGDTKTFAGTEFTSNGLQNGESIGSVTLTSSGAVATAGVAGSPYTIVPSAATGGSFAAGNYSISYTNGSLSVNRAALSISPLNQTKVFGDQLPATTTQFLATGLLLGQTIGYVQQSTDGAPGPAAAGQSYGITLSGAAGGTFDPSNYSITYVSYVAGVSGGAVTVTPLAPRIIPMPLIAQPPNPPVISPSGLNYVPVTASGAPTGQSAVLAPMTNTASAGVGGAGAGGVVSAGGGTVAGGGTTAGGSTVAGGGTGAAGGAAAGGGAAGGGAGGIAGGNAEGGAGVNTAGTSGSGTGSSSGSSESAPAGESPRSTSQFTAIGQVRDLVGPTNVRVVDGGINFQRR